MLSLVSSLSITNIPANQTYTNPVNFNITSSEIGNGSLINDFGNNLISWWRMDEINSTGHPLDYMGRNNATKFRSANQSDGYFGKGFSFNTTGANGAYLITPSNAGLSTLDANWNNYTVSLWLKGKNESQNMAGFRVIEKRASGGGNYPFSWQGGPWQMTMVVYDGSKVPLVTFNVSNGGFPFDDNWHHMVMVVDAETNKIYGYKDGILVGNVTNTVTVTTANTQGVTIGSGQLGASNAFNGSIDDVMIWNRSLSSNEVLALFNATEINYNKTLLNGTYTYTTYTQNRTASIISNTSTFNINTSAPIINIFSPLNRTYYSSLINFNINSSEQGNGSIVPNLDNSLISWWRMDDISRNTNIDYMNRYNGNIVNALQIDGIFAKAFYFSGNTTSYIITASTGFGTEASWINGTTSLWAKRTGNGSTVSQGTLYSREASRPAMFLYYDNSTFAPLGTSVYAYHYNGSIFNQLTCDFTNEQGLNWTHYAKTWSYNGTHTNQTLYVNGTICNNSIFLGSAAVTSNDHWRLGAWANGAGASVTAFNGSIDDFIFFNRTLDKEEILAIYNATKIDYNKILNNNSHIFRAYTQNKTGIINYKENLFSIVTGQCWRIENNLIIIPLSCGFLDFMEILEALN